MNNFLIIKGSLCLLLLCTSQICFAQMMQWQKPLGGTWREYGSHIQNTSDGGYISIGYTQSSDGDVIGFNGLFPDIWVTKLTDLGTLQWQALLGGSSIDYGQCIQQTTDGGYVLAGTTQSNDRDVSGNHGGVGPGGYPNQDGWVVKLNAAGTIEWQKCFGGTLADYLSFVQPTLDGGYILVGNASSTDGDVTGNHGGSDIWVIKITSNGTIQWQKALGGSANDYGSTIQITSDGGYILLGRVRSNNGDVSGNHGNDDMWAVKLSSNGTIEWQKTLGGTANDYSSFVQIASDGGYILAGSTASNDGDVSGNHGGNGDMWVAKLSSIGVLEWQKTLGGTGDEDCTSIQPTSDGGYILSAYTDSNDGDVSGNHGGYDAWLVKVSSTGVLEWQKTFGGTAYEDCQSMQTTTDGGCVLMGSTASNDGDVNGNHGDVDFWVVKIDNIGVAITNQITITDVNIFPNPISQDRVTLNCYLAHSTCLEMIVSDMLGNVIVRESEPIKLIGVYQKEIKLGNIVSGIYFLQLQTEYGNTTTKIVKN